MDSSDCNARSIAGVTVLLLGLTFTSGCNCRSKEGSADRSAAAFAVGSSSGTFAIEPALLKRVAPPNLVRLTDFNHDQIESADATIGPQLTPPSSSSGGTKTAPAGWTSAGGERFVVIDPPAPKVSDSSPQQAAESRPNDGTSQATGTILPWGPTTPTPEMTAITKRAEDIARRGYDLAERGGLYSARVRFTESLRVIAEALDAQRNTAAHTKALAAGLRALEEVDDFVPRGMQIDVKINMPLIVDAHRTPILKDRSLDEITPLVAQRIYLTYAQEQLAMAGGDQAVASLALHGMGKICITPAQMNGPRTQIAEAKAVVYFQAAVIIEPQNFMSANELGVLLARFGRPQDARQALEQAVSCSNSPITWRNLAIVSERLGDTPKAVLCRERAELAVAESKQAGTNNAGSQYPIRWVDPTTFARSNTMVPDATPATGQLGTATDPTAPTTAAKSDPKAGGWKWPWQ
ncbi:MAG: hypothetical protein IT427_17695 [Pirellulales bacterium]|nr:hypothetical protein [Pirellulales bacterium]